MWHDPQKLRDFAEDLATFAFSAFWVVPISAVAGSLAIDAVVGAVKSLRSVGAL